MGGGKEGRGGGGGALPAAARRKPMSMRVALMLEEEEFVGDKSWEGSGASLKVLRDRAGMANRVPPKGASRKR